MLTDSLKKVLEDYMVPDVYPVSELPYLPSGRLDRQKLLKLYKFRLMESRSSFLLLIWDQVSEHDLFLSMQIIKGTPEEWKSLNMTIGEKQAAKILFEAISRKFTHNLASLVYILYVYIHKYVQNIDTIGLTLRFVMSNYHTSIWEIGVNSLNALLIVYVCRENGYLICNIPILTCLSSLKTKLLIIF